MNLFAPVSSFIGMFLVMILATLWLKSQNILKEEHTPVISKMITDLVYPALIFSQVAKANITLDLLTAASAMICSLIVGATLNWLMGTYLFRLSRPGMSALILAGTFGSATLIGSSLLQVVFQGQPELIGKGLVIAQFSESLLINTLGIFIAIHYSSVGKVPPTEQIKTFLLSKPILALILGLAWYLMSVPTVGFGQRILFGGLTMLSAALPFLAAIVTGLAFNWGSLGSISTLLLLTAVVQLIVEPMVSELLIKHFNLPEDIRYVALLLEALPASSLAVAFCARYNGDTKMASAITLCTSALSAITLPLATLLA